MREGPSVTQLLPAIVSQLPGPGQTVSSQSRTKSPPIFPLSDPSPRVPACWFPRVARGPVPVPHPSCPVL